MITMILSDIAHNQTHVIWLIDLHIKPMYQMKAEEMLAKDTKLFGRG